MKERPILFSGEMVRAILDGRKTMTRRIVKPQPVYPEAYEPCRSVLHGDEILWFIKHAPEAFNRWRCPFGGIGDRLWVRETWGTDGVHSNIIYAADLSTVGQKILYKRSPLFMSRSMSRITLEITNIRVERLQDISEADAEAEGLQYPHADEDQDGAPDAAQSRSYRQSFKDLWQEINGKRASWELNPWVWVIEFKRVEGER